jgi:integrase
MATKRANNNDIPGSVVLNEDRETWNYLYVKQDGNRTSKLLGRQGELTEAEAWERARAFLKQQETTVWTVAKVIGRYHDGKVRNLRDSSQRTYGYFYRLIDQKFGGWEMEKVLAGPVEDWLDRASYAPGTKAQIRAMLVQPTEYLTREIFWKWVALLGAPYRTMAFIGIGHGLRIGEVLGFRWRDIDWELQTLTLDRQQRKGEGRKLKTENSRKVFDIGPREMAELKLWRIASEWKAPQDWVFASWRFRGQRPYAREAVKWAFQKAGKALGVERRWNTHILRHSHAFWAREYMGANPEVVKQSMRHERLSTTEGYGRQRMSKAARDLQISISEMAFRGMATSGDCESVQ